MEKFEIRAVITYFCKKGMPPKGIHEDFMETLGKESPSYSTVKIWIADFKRGRESIEDYGRSGPPKDATVDENVKVVPTLVIFWAEQSILTDILGMSEVSARWVLRMLTIIQKRTRLDMSRYLQSHYEVDPVFIERVDT